MNTDLIAAITPGGFALAGGTAAVGELLATIGQAAGDDD